MIIALTVAPPTMLSAAVCHHHSALEHALARSSKDPNVANAARSEETAALLAKKGTLANESSFFFLADMLPATQLALPFPTTETVRRIVLNESLLPGAAIPPLLQPPAA